MLAQSIEALIFVALSAAVAYFAMTTWWPWGYGGGYDIWWCMTFASSLWLWELRKL